jgi:hypothetical protein
MCGELDSTVDAKDVIENLVNFMHSSDRVLTGDSARFDENLTRLTTMKIVSSLRLSKGTIVFSLR